MDRILLRFSLFILLFTLTQRGSTQCFYTLIMADSYGDGWDGGQILVISGANISAFSLDDGYADTVQILVTPGLPLSMTWVDGGFTFDVESFILLNDVGDTLFLASSPQPIVFYEGIGACVTCATPLNFNIENVYDTRVKLRWTPDPNSVNSAVNWKVIYGVQGFLPQDGVGDTITVTTPKVTITGLQKKSKYDAYLVQNCGPGDLSKVIGPLSFETYWTNDVGISGVVTPVSKCGLGFEKVTVIMKNHGSAPQSLIPFRYFVNGQDAGVGQPGDGFYTGVLGKDSCEILEFETMFNFEEPGEYRIDVITEMNGDEDLQNDTFTYYVNNTLEAPYAQGFEQWDGGWFVETGSVAPSWAYGTPNKAFIATAAEGEKAWVTGGLAGAYNINEKSYLHSPCYDFSSLTIDPYLSCAVIYKSELNSDGAWLEISFNEGQTWTKVGAQGQGINWYNTDAQFWSGQSSGWVNARIVLTGASGQANVQLRFVFDTDPSVIDEGFGVDNIRISNNVAKDLAPVLIKTQGESQSLACGKQADKVILTIANLGSESFTPTQLAYSINGGIPVVETVNIALIAPNASYTYTFVGTFDSRDKESLIKCWIIASGDQVAPNDTFQYRVNYAPFALPLKENFEASEFLPANWDTNPTNSGNVYFSGAHSNVSNVFAVNLYSSIPSFTLNAPRVGLLNTGSVLKFDYRIVDYSFPNPATIYLFGNKVDVQISKDCGSTYQNVYTITPTNHIPSTDMKTISVNLTNFENEDVKLRFKGTYFIGDYWVDIDNINILTCAENFNLSANVLVPSAGGTGQIAILTDGGNAPYQYAWSNGATTKSVDNLSPNTYTVTVTDALGCTDVIVIPLGVSATDEIAGLSHLVLYPNPSTGLATLRAEFDHATDVEMEVFNMQGQRVWMGQVLHTDLVSQSLDLTAYPQGLYLVRLTADGQSLSRKLLIAGE